MKDSRKLYNLIKKIKNKELLNDEDLIIFAELLEEEKMMSFQGIEKFEEPAYATKEDILLINGDIESRWFQAELAYFYDGQLIKPHLEYKKRIKPVKTEDYNFVLLNSVAHEARHAYQQRLIKYHFRNEKDITLLKNLLMSLKKHSILKNFLFHDYLYYEYDADLNAALEINKFNEIYLNMDLTNYNEFAAYKILRAYTSTDLKKITTPIENNEMLFGTKNKIKNKELLPVKEYIEMNKETEETIFNGGNVDKKLLEMLKDVYMGDTKVKNIEKVLK